MKKLPMSLDVALDIIGTLRMMAIDKLAKETDTEAQKELEKQFELLTFEERVAQGLERFDGWQFVRQSVMDKIERLYAPQLKAIYAAQ